MSIDNKHPVVMKIRDYQRQQSAKTWACPHCPNEAAFPSEQRLYGHAAELHPAEAGSSQQSTAFKNYAAESINFKVKQSQSRRVLPELSKVGSNDSTRPNFGDDDVKSPSPSTRPTSLPNARASKDKKIEDFNQLSLNPGPEPMPGDATWDHQTLSPTSNPLKRAAAAESGLSDQPIEPGTPPRIRRAKAYSGGSFIPKDQDYYRKGPESGDRIPLKNRNGPQQRLFDPNTDRVAAGPSPRRLGRADGALTSRKVYDQRSNVFRSQKGNADESGRDNKYTFNQDPIVPSPGPTRHGVPVKQSFQQEESVEQPDLDNFMEADPEILLQPETRPISHDQLVVEVKGIYAGLVMVEAKCIDVDEKQAAAAQEKDPLKRNKLTPEQWQALIALHKTLLHEHHDFFLASQHPSASPALSRLAAKYSMPARMWRHGIHGFLEVLRHRLPDSLDHMLAFIYIAYSMMALLYETVPTFEETWIECLGDLGRYRMAIEDDDIRDREVWSGVARFWYGKAADKSPKIGRLYHHLAILAPAYTLQQLSLYTRSLTCITPFESAKGSIMTLVTPILEGKQSTRNRSSSMETVFLKAHAILFTEGSLQDYADCLESLFGGLLDACIGRITIRFKELGVFAALSNISSLFEYGVIRAKGGSRSLLRLTLEESRSRRETSNGTQAADSVDVTPSSEGMQPETEPLTLQEREISLQRIALASEITFGTLAVALQRIGDANVYPLVHVNLVFIYSIIDIKEAMAPLESTIPWIKLAFFLSALAKPEALTSKVFGETFPKPDEGVGRPLPEDFLTRGLLWTEFVYPTMWFSEAAIDDEERSLELPSMAAPRLERMLWLGIGIASRNRWLSFDKASRSFTVTQRVNDFPARKAYAGQPTPAAVDNDSIMSGFDEDEDTSMSIPDSSPASREPSTERPRSERTSPTLTKNGNDVHKMNPVKSPIFAPTRILKKDHTETPNPLSVKHEAESSPGVKPTNADSEEWLKGQHFRPDSLPQKSSLDRYASETLESQATQVFDVSSGRDPSEA